MGSMEPDPSNTSLLEAFLRKHPLVSHDNVSFCLLNNSYSNA